MMVGMRPTLEEIAEARALATRMLFHRSDDLVLMKVLRTFIATTAPLTKEQAIPVMVGHANKAGDWKGTDADIESATKALMTDSSVGRSGWQDVVWAQWATLVHFNGGVE
jgi:dTDP-4-amino-4,6-dideoxygalactose transaminase